jgi:O-glycosyl hydrolase
MGNDEEIGGGGGYDFTMKTALYVARVIHHDLVYANAESWSWWRAAGGDYRDGLIRIYSKDGWKSGWAADSKLMWALGNYSRFIRPGARRYDITAADQTGTVLPEGYNDPTGVMCSAYRNEDGRWVVVAINYSEELKPVNFRLDAGAASRWQMYRTSDISAESLAPVGECQGETSLAPRSITTFVSK